MDLRRIGSGDMNCIPLAQNTAQLWVSVYTIEPSVFVKSGKSARDIVTIRGGGGGPIYLMIVRETAGNVLARRLTNNCLKIFVGKK
jgi:hypothetical protein